MSAFVGMNTGPRTSRPRTSWDTGDPVTDTLLRIEGLKERDRERRRMLEEKRRAYEAQRERLLPVEVEEGAGRHRRRPVITGGNRAAQVVGKEARMEKRLRALGLSREDLAELGMSPEEFSAAEERFEERRRSPGALPPRPGGLRGLAGELAQATVAAGVRAPEAVSPDLSRYYTPSWANIEGQHRPFARAIEMAGSAMTPIVGGLGWLKDKTAPGTLASNWPGVMQLNAALSGGGLALKGLGYAGEKISEALPGPTVAQALANPQKYSDDELGLALLKEGIADPSLAVTGGVAVAPKLAKLAKFAKLDRVPGALGAAGRATSRAIGRMAEAPGPGSYPPEAVARARGEGAAIAARRDAIEAARAAMADVTSAAAQSARQANREMRTGVLAERITHPAPISEQLSPGGRPLELMPQRMTPELAEEVGSLRARDAELSLVERAKRIEAAEREALRQQSYINTTRKIREQVEAQKSQATARAMLRTLEDVQKAGGMRPGPSTLGIEEDLKRAAVEARLAKLGEPPITRTPPPAGPTLDEGIAKILGETAPTTGPIEIAPLEPPSLGAVARERGMAATERDIRRALDEPARRETAEAARERLLLNEQRGVIARVLAQADEAARRAGLPQPSAAPLLPDARDAEALARLARREKRAGTAEAAMEAAERERLSKVEVTPPKKGKKGPDEPPAPPPEPVAPVVSPPSPTRPEPPLSGRAPEAPETPAAPLPQPRQEPPLMSEAMTDEAVREIEEAARRAPFIEAAQRRRTAAEAKKMARERAAELEAQRQTEIDAAWAKRERETLAKGRERARGETPPPALNPARLPPEAETVEARMGELESLKRRLEILEKPERRVRESAEAKRQESYENVVKKTRYQIEEEAKRAERERLRQRIATFEARRGKPGGPSVAPLPPGPAPSPATQPRASEAGKLRAEKGTPTPSPAGPTETRIEPPPPKGRSPAPEPVAAPPPAATVKEAPPVQAGAPGGEAPAPTPIRAKTFKTGSVAAKLQAESDHMAMKSAQPKGPRPAPKSATEAAARAGAPVGPAPSKAAEKAAGEVLEKAAGEIKAARKARKKGKPGLFDVPLGFANVLPDGWWNPFEILAGGYRLGAKGAEKGLKWWAKRKLPGTGSYFIPTEEGRKLAPIMRRAQIETAIATTKGADILNDIGSKLSKEDQQLVGRAMRGELSPPPTGQPSMARARQEVADNIAQLPAHLQDAARKATDAMLDIGQELVDAGVLHADTFMANAGHYLANRYRTKEVDSFLKKTFGANRPSVESLIKRKDIPREVQEALGMFLEPGPGVARTMAKEGRLGALSRAWKKIADDPDLAIEVEKRPGPEWSERPLRGSRRTTFFKGTDKEMVVTEFGALEGKYVKLDVEKVLKEALDVSKPGEIERVVKAYARIYRFVKVPANLKSWFNNVVTGYITADFADASMLKAPGSYSRAVRALRGQDPGFFKELIDGGVIKTDYGTIDFAHQHRKLIRELMPDAVKDQSLADWMEKLADYVTSDNKISKKMGAGYGFTDDVFKAAAYDKFRKDGLDAKAAAAKVREHFVYYDEMPGFVAAAERYPVLGPMFFKYTWGSTKILHEALKTPRGWFKLLKWLSYIEGMNLGVDVLFGKEPGKTSEQISETEFRQGGGMRMGVPWSGAKKGGSELAGSVDLRFSFPFGDQVSAAGMALNAFSEPGKTAKRFVQDYGTGPAGKAMAMAITGRNVDRPDKPAKLGDFIEAAAPIPGGLVHGIPRLYGALKGFTSPTGVKENPAMAALSAIGPSVTPLDPESLENTARFDARRVKREAMAEGFDATRRGKPVPDRGKETIEAGREADVRSRRASAHGKPKMWSGSRAWGELVKKIEEMAR